MEDDLDPTPEGLVRCLQVLAEEAACMRLSQTFAALQDAIATCREESDGKPGHEGRREPAGLVH